MEVSQRLRKAGRNEVNRYSWLSLQRDVTDCIEAIHEMLFVVQSLNPVQLVTPWTEAHQASLSFTLPEIAQTHVHWARDAIQPSHLLSPFLLLPSIFPSIRVFSNESFHSYPMKCLQEIIKTISQLVSPKLPHKNVHLSTKIIDLSLLSTLPRHILPTESNPVSSYANGLHNIDPTNPNTLSLFLSLFPSLFCTLYTWW